MSVWEAISLNACAARTQLVRCAAAGTDDLRVGGKNLQHTGNPLGQGPFIDGFPLPHIISSAAATGGLVNFDP